jgi:hypothetical protein
VFLKNSHGILAVVYSQIHEATFASGKRFELADMGVEGSTKLGRKGGNLIPTIHGTSLCGLSTSGIGVEAHLWAATFVSIRSENIK